MAEVDEYIAKAEHALDNGFYTDARNYYEKAVALGSSKAINGLGDYYMSINMPEEAFKQYKEAASLGYPAAYYNLGISYKEGDGVEQDAEMAIHYLNMAADAGEAGAYLELAQIYTYPRYGAEQDFTLAKYYLEKAVEEDDGGYAENTFGYFYVLEDNPYYDPVEAERWYMRAERHGNIWALVNHGDLCRFGGEGFEPDLYEAERLYKEAIEQKFWEAYIYLGDLYLSRECDWAGERDAAIAYRNAHFWDVPGASDKLLDLVIDTNLDTYNPHEAEGLLRPLAEEDNYWAKAELGRLLFFGEGVKEDKDEAISLFEDAAEWGNNHYAQRMLADIYYEGDGVWEDKQKALKYYLEAGEQGDGEAFWNAACMYQDGDGVPRDQHKARQYFDKAEDLGYYGPSDVFNNDSFDDFLDLIQDDF